MITLRGLTKRYGARLAVDDLTADIRPGRITALVGPAGAGKSSTLKMIVGLDRPTAGEARIAGRRYAELRHPLRAVGALLDPGWVHPRRSGQAHLAWLAATNGLRRQRVDEVLEFVGLTAVAGNRAGSYPPAVSRRLGVAAALLGDPGVLLFDEPTDDLDPEGVLWFRGLVRQLAAEGRTVLVSSRSLAEVVATAEDLVAIGRGRLIAFGPVSDFGQRRTTVCVRAPSRDALATALRARGLSVEDEPERDALFVHGTTTERVGELAAGLGLALHELTLSSVSLEDAFRLHSGQEPQDAGARA